MSNIGNIEEQAGLVDPQAQDNLYRGTSRRGLLGQALGAGLFATAGMWAAGCGGGGTDSVTNSPAIGTSPTASPTATPTPRAVTEADVLNFALNLEYLEAEYYLRGVTGTGLSTTDSGNAGTVTGGRQVTFATDAVRQYFNEVATDELNHVRFLRSALGSNAVVRPNINFTDAFNAAAQAAGLGSSFDPFANETNFLIGAFVFEDVGVTAYRGGSTLLTTPSVIQAAAGILAVEAFHAGVVRSLLADQFTTGVGAANAISLLRAQAGGGKDETINSGTITAGGANYAPTDAQGRTYSRTTAEVLRIVYLTPTGTPSSGGFFPSGMNGFIRTAS